MTSQLGGMEWLRGCGRHRFHLAFPTVHGFVACLGGGGPSRSHARVCTDAFATHHAECMGMCGVATFDPQRIGL
jgi:hypothetical protein